MGDPPLRKPRTRTSLGAQNGRVRSEESLAEAYAALAEGRWREARAAFDLLLADGESADARFGLAVALWWLGENRACVAACARAYALFRQSREVEQAVRCAVWLAITYKANFGNFSAANGWIGRAERLLHRTEPGALHGWVLVARAYRMADLESAETLTVQACELARSAGDEDLELVALSQLGLVRVGRGETAAGFALIDEVMAAALAGDRTTLDTVVYVCCDMLNACELADDVERAAQWCAVADDFVGTYGCPFLYAECRIAYGSVLTSAGSWSDAERELHTGLRITDGACPGLHSKALARLAHLRIRQGRLEEAEMLLARLGGVEAEAEAALSVAALLVARGDAPAASRNLEQRLHGLGEHRSYLAVALDLLVDARLAGGDLVGARSAAHELAELASSVDSQRLGAMSAGVEGRVAMARGNTEEAVVHMAAALRAWSRLGLPFELARSQFELGRALADSQPDVAVDHARRALRAFESLGAALEVDRVAAFLRSRGVVARVGVKGVGLLTSREQEVVQLLRAGLSNPEIAARLHVSRKTVSHHVSSILAKLQLRNRAEVAAYAVDERGALTGSIHLP